MVICLERGADLHMAQLIPLPLTVSCFSIIQIGFTFLVPAAPENGPLNGCVCVCLCLKLSIIFLDPVNGIGTVGLQVHIMCRPTL